MKKVILFSIICCFIIFSKGFAATNQIVVNQNMSFGTIEYKDTPSIYSIDKNNALQSNNRASNYGVNSKLAVITIYGKPEEEVALSFGSAKLVGNVGAITLSNIETVNGSNIIKLDKTGKATVELSGTLNINKEGLIGAYQGSFSVWGSYQGSKLDGIVSQSVAVNATLMQQRGSMVKQLTFGTIYYKKKDSCSVTITTSNTANTTCVSVSGAQRFEYKGTTLMGLMPNLQGYISLPSSINLTGSRGDLLVMNNFKVAVTVSVAPWAGFNYNLYIGATLNIPKNAKGGTYSGTYDVIINL